MRRLFKSPLHVCLIGVFVLSVGIHSVVQLLSGLIQGKPEFSPEFLAIFIGIGLLRGSSGCRGFLGAILAINLVVAGAVCLLAVIQGLFFVKDGWMNLFVGIGFLFLAIGYVFKALGDAKNDPWFTEDRDQKSPPFVVAVTVALTLLYSIAYEVQSFDRRTWMAEVFPFDLDIVVRDAVSGERLNQAGIGLPDQNFEDVEIRAWMEGVRVSSGEEGDVMFSIEGFALGETEFTLTCEGFESAKIPLNEMTGSFVEVMLKPIPK